MDAEGFAPASLCSPLSHCPSEVPQPHWQAGLEQTSVLQGCWAKHQNKPNKGKNTGRGKTWAWGEKGNEEGALHCLEAPRTQRMKTFQWPIFHYTCLGLNPPMKSLPMSHLLPWGREGTLCSHSAWGSGEMPWHRISWAARDPQGSVHPAPAVLEPKSPKASSWKESGRIIIPVRSWWGSASQLCKQLDKHLAVIELLRVPVWGITVLTGSAPCWKPPGFIRQACSCMHCTHTMQLPSHGISSEQGTHLAGAAANLTFANKFKKK